MRGDYCNLVFQERLSHPETNTANHRIIFMENTTNELRNGLEVAWMNTAAFLPKLAIFLVILVVGYFLAKFLAKLAARQTEAGMIAVIS